MRNLACLSVVLSFVTTGAAFALNPQPLPPSPAKSLFSASPSVKFLNPQPLPPRWSSSSITNPGVKALNPQPLPPRWQPQILRFGR